MNKGFTLSSIRFSLLLYVKTAMKRLFYPSRTYLKRSVIGKSRVLLWKIILPRLMTCSRTSSRNKRHKLSDMYCLFQVLMVYNSNICERWSFFCKEDKKSSKCDGCKFKNWDKFQKKLSNAYRLSSSDLSSSDKN